MTYKIVFTCKHGIELWILAYNGALLGTYMSEGGAISAKMRHEQIKRIEKENTQTK